MTKYKLTAITSALLLLATPAFACKGPNVQFSDDFREVDASWGAEPSMVTVEEGKVKIKADPNSGYNIIYSGTRSASPSPRPRTPIRPTRRPAA